MSVENKQSLYKKFKRAWIALTVVFIGVVLYLQWQHVSGEKKRNYQVEANTLAYNLDDYLEELLKSIDKLPMDQIKGNNCLPSLLSKLQSNIFNNPNISAIVISNLDNKILCSTSYKFPSFSSTINEDPILIGPLHLKETKQPVYLLQKTVVGRKVGIYILQSTLKSILDKSSAHFDFIGLYDHAQKKMLLELGEHIHYSSLSTEDKQDYSPNLQNFDNVNLILHPSSMIFPYQLLKSILLITLPLILFSWGLYNYSARLLRYRFSLNFALETAVRAEQFYPVYQGLWNESLQCFQGAEVLLRWKSNHNEIIMPDTFIDEAEKTDIIIPITLQLIEKAFKENEHFLHKNPQFHLGFNISPKHFYEGEFFTSFYTLCQTYQIQPSQVMLELTERVLFNHNDSVVLNKMNELREKGYHLAVDDFGTGQSNINYLQLFPFNFLKIDKLFIKFIGTGIATEQLNDIIINMAKTLKLKIIAEGVETQEQRDYLYKNQVDFIQGWFYAKALPYKEFMILIEQYKEKL